MPISKFVTKTLSELRLGGQAATDIYRRVIDVLSEYPTNEQTDHLVRAAAEEYLDKANELAANCCTGCARTYNYIFEFRPLKGGRAYVEKVQIESTQIVELVTGRYARLFREQGLQFCAHSYSPDEYTLDITSAHEWATSGQWMRVEVIRESDEDTEGAQDCAS